jgi:cystine transport system substrate-binding protein
MKKRFLEFSVVILLLTLSFGTVFAEDKKTDYAAEIKTAQDEASGIQAELDTTLTAVNDVYQKAYASKQAVVNGQAKITEISAAITQTEAEITEREAVMAKQMRKLQVDNVESTFLSTILSSKNLSDMLTKVVSLQTYRKMQNEKVVQLDKSKTDLTQLRADLQIQQKQLQENEQKYTEESANLETKLATLRTQIADNQAQITALSSSKAAEEKRQADAAAREAAKAVAEPKAPSVNQPIVSGNDSEAEPTPTPERPAGSSMTVSTTGYSSDGADGMTPGHITATGIDLWVNPMCLAVDPSVIPLGSMVEVPGYGIAIAGDTGGAIKGYKVDLHFRTTKEAINWGRRTMTIRVLG